MTRKQLLAIVVVAAVTISTAVVAKQQTVLLKDGRRLSGEVTKTKDGYEIKTPAGTVVLAAQDVLRVEEAVTPGEEFKKRLAATDPQDPEALYRLASWARDNDMLTEARDLLKKVMALSPNHEGARLLLRLVEISLASKLATATAQSQPEAPLVDASKLLTMEDVYRIRLLELSSRDRLSIEFRDKVLEQFIEAMRGRDVLSRAEERRFRGWDRVRQAMYMLDNTDRADTAIRDNILVKGDPEVFRTFRGRIWPVINESCARPSCHGGVKGAGQLKLFDMPVTDDRVLYTNFYILHAWQRDGRKLINRDQPGNSMLLQAGLPTHIAKQGLAHPKEVVPPVFPSERDRNFRVIEEWILTLRRPFLPPGYRVSYKLPGLQQEEPPATTAPAPLE